MRTPIALLIGLAVIAIAAAWWAPPVAQAPAYHNFADSRTIFGIANFWNVVSNAPFLLVALWAFPVLSRRDAFRHAWERRACAVMFTGLASVAAGSSYYHYRPCDSTLFWDRLPMTIVFTSLLAITVGERVNERAGRLLFIPLLLAGIASPVIWRITGDLRAYGLIQFYPMLAVPLMLVLFPACYTAAGGIWAMAGLYVMAKAFELADQAIWNIAAPLSGHPLKHLAGAAAMLCYVEAVRRRRPVAALAAEPADSPLVRLQHGAQ